MRQLITLETYWLRTMSIGTPGYTNFFSEISEISEIPKLTQTRICIHISEEDRALENEKTRKLEDEESKERKGKEKKRKYGR